MARQVLPALLLFSLLSACQQVRQADQTFGKRMDQTDQMMASRPPTASLGGIIRGADPLLGTLEHPSEHGDALSSGGVEARSGVGTRTGSLAEWWRTSAAHFSENSAQRHRKQGIADGRPDQRFRG
jgi:hypothetical protein